MVRELLVRGMLVGIVAGMLSFGFLKLYGEPQVDQAIAFETQQDEAKEAGAEPHGAPGHHHETGGHHEEPQEIVSRRVQAGIGLLTGVVVYCTAFGGLFALVFAFAFGRIDGVLTARGASLLLAAAGFVAAYLVPSLKYPANPPAVGSPDTIGLRTALYFVMIAISIAAMVAAIGLKGRLAHRHGDWNAMLIAAGAYVVLVAVAALLLPAINEVPAQFPAAVLWNFRVASIGAQLIMWATIGLLFGALTQRAWGGPKPRP